jgi:hypothetical protein
MCPRRAGAGIVFDHIAGRAQMVAEHPEHAVGGRLVGQQFSLNN